MIAPILPHCSIRIRVRSHILRPNPFAWLQHIDCQSIAKPHGGDNVVEGNAVQWPGFSASRPATYSGLATTARNAEPVATASEMTRRSLSGQTNSGLWRPGQGGARAMARARLCRQSNTRHATNRYFGQCQSTQSMLVVLALSPWRWWNGERVTSPSITPPYRALLQAGRPLDIVVLP